MALQNLRSSTAHKRPTPGSLSDGQVAINTNSGSPGLFYKDSAGALVKAGPVHVGTTAPNASPASGGQSGNSTGELWLDTNSTPNQLKVWNGSAFVSPTDDIAVSQLANGTARQLLQTNSGGTSVEFTSNVDVPGTLDVTGATTLDSTLAITGQTTLAEIKETTYTLTGTALDPGNGSLQTKTLAANTTFTDSLQAGQSMVLHLGAGASYTVTWPTITWVTASGDTAPTLTADDVLVFWKISTTLYGAYVGSAA